MDDPNAKPTHDFSRGCGGCLVVVVVIVAALWIAWEVYSYRAEMARIPQNLSIEYTVYENEEAWGFGPGGNETGLTLYRLNGEDAARLLKLAHGPSESELIRAVMGRRPDRRDYGTWRPTPIDPSAEDFLWDREHIKGNPARIADFLGHYGFTIEVDPKIAAGVDRIINAPGAYYAPGRGGTLIIVAPREKLVIFAYAG